MTIRILRARDRLATPWKNGGGVTREIAAFPPGSSLDTFGWRASMASVTAGGPFSLFPGVDRVLSVLEGDLDLVFGDGSTLSLSPRSPPAAFAGDTPVCAEPPTAPVTDLNVMTRRGRARADVTRAHLATPLTIAPTAPTLIVSRASRVRLGDADTLGMDDAALIEGEPTTIEGAPGAEVFIVHFNRA